jgi:hypothetical protein
MVERKMDSTAITQTPAGGESQWNRTELIKDLPKLNPQVGSGGDQKTGSTSGGSSATHLEFTDPYPQAAKGEAKNSEHTRQRSSGSSTDHTSKDGTVNQHKNNNIDFTPNASGSSDNSRGSAGSQDKAGAETLQKGTGDANSGAPKDPGKGDGSKDSSHGGNTHKQGDGSADSSPGGNTHKQGDGSTAGRGTTQPQGDGSTTGRGTTQPQGDGSTAGQGTTQPQGDGSTAGRGTTQPQGDGSTAGQGTTQPQGDGSTAGRGTTQPQGDGSVSDRKRGSEGSDGQASRKSSGSLESTGDKSTDVVQGAQAVKTQAMSSQSGS